MTLVVGFYKEQGRSTSEKMKKIVNHLKKFDWILIISVFLLTAIGFLSLYSSSFSKKDFLNLEKQAVFFTIGVFLMFFLSFFNWRIFKQNPYLILIIYFICLFSLVGLFFFAPEIRGVRSWYKLGPFSLDPLEFMRIVLIILLAKYFSMRHVEMYQKRHILLSGFYIFLPALLIFFQPNLGAVLIIFALWLGILIISGIRLRHFLYLIFIFALIFVFSWSFLLKNYQRERIISFIQPQIDPQGMGWSQQQSKIAIGSGRIFGQGIGKGSQTQHGFLTEPQTDFIFAAITEEFGLLGAAILLILFSVLIWSIVRIALNSGNNFSRLYATGFAILLFSQIFINIGMNLGILPIIGIPLPFISYGGSNMIANFIGLGILESIKMH